jgi:KUP system potassium uptake protein
VMHTSDSTAGQIYMPQVNTILLVGVLLLVFLFETSSRLATAYGISVTGTMVVTTCLAFVVVWKHWRWPLAFAAALILPFFAVDAIFLASNLAKVTHGGYVPLIIASGLMVAMWTWVRGTQILMEKSRRAEVSLSDLVHSLERKKPTTVSGTAVFLTSNPASAPSALLHSLKHYKVLHEKIVLLTIVTENVPRVSDTERVTMEPLNTRFSRICLRFGFMEEPNVPRALGLCRKMGWKFDIMSTSFFLSRRSIRPSAQGPMAGWQEKLFMGLARNASDATDYFRIPTNRVVEIGAQFTV